MSEKKEVIPDPNLPAHKWRVFICRYPNLNPSYKWEIDTTAYHLSDLIHSVMKSEELPIGRYRITAKWSFAGKGSSQAWDTIICLAVKRVNDDD